MYHSYVFKITFVTTGQVFESSGHTVTAGAPLGDVPFRF